MDLFCSFLLVKKVEPKVSKTSMVKPCSVTFLKRLKTIFGQFLCFMLKNMMLRTEDHNNKESKNCLFSLKNPRPFPQNIIFCLLLRKYYYFSLSVMENAKKVRFCT
jgi:hypothetical protein